MQFCDGRMVDGVLEDILVCVLAMELVSEAPVFDTLISGNSPPPPHDVVSALAWSFATQPSNTMESN